MKMKTWK